MIRKETPHLFSSKRFSACADPFLAGSVPKVCLLPNSSAMGPWIIWLWVKMNRQKASRSSSFFPFTWIPFGVPIFDPHPYGGGTLMYPWTSELSEKVMSTSGGSNSSEPWRCFLHFGTLMCGRIPASPWLQPSRLGFAPTSMRRETTRLTNRRKPGDFVSHFVG